MVTTKVMLVAMKAIEILVMIKVTSVVVVMLMMIATSVADLVDNNGDWNLPLLNMFLPHDIVKRIKVGSA